MLQKIISDLSSTKFSGTEINFFMITQKNYPAVEFSCYECRGVIINPLCPACLTIEVEAWLTMYPDLRSKIMPKLKNYIRKLQSRLTDYTRCIKCNKLITILCPYCFTEVVLKELKVLNVNKIVLKEFFEFFNFDFRHTGYSKEAEKLGVI